MTEKQGLMQWRNPMGAAGSGFIRSRHYSGAASGFSIPAGSTTTTSTYQVVGNTIITITNARTTVEVPFRLTLSHSVGRALIYMAVRIFTDDIGTAIFATDVVGNYTLPPTANDWTMVQMVGGIDIGGNGGVSGRKLIYVMVSNQTAGTLSWGEPNSTDNYGVTLKGQVNQ